MRWSLNVGTFVILCLTRIISSSFGINCFLQHRNYQCKLGINTPYRFIANYEDTPPEYPGCVPKKIWLLLRHGTRYPSRKYLLLMIERLPKLQEVILANYRQNKTSLTPEDAALLARWQMIITEDDNMKLDEEGETEMIDLAERYQSRFPSLMSETYNNRTYKFKYTATQRTQESAKHFAAGLFGWHNSRKVWYPEPEYEDLILRFYKRCIRWHSEIKNNPDAQMETKKFLKSEVYTKILHGVSERIGHQIDQETIHLMHTTCGLETAWKKEEESPWCKMFSAKDFGVLEFAEDLKYYWRDGYGHKLTYEQACPTLKDMMDSFTSSEGPLVTAYFTHSGTVLKLLALLGIAKDDHHLTHDLYPQYGDERAWRTSIIDTFATNVAFVLYEYSPGNLSVLFMHQERPIYLPGCPLNIPCPLSIMKALYPDHEEECQFVAMCDIYN